MKLLFLTFVEILLLQYFGLRAAELPCNALKLKEDSIVCVCDEQYCDSSDPVLPGNGQYLLVSSDKDGKRFATSYGPIKKKTWYYSEDSCDGFLFKRSAILHLQRDKTRQKIIGFGGAFTDAAGYNLLKINQPLREQVFKSYFGQSGLKYNMGRTSVGHCDYSVNEYYYAEENDVNMDTWKLQYEDFAYRIPFIKKAIDMCKDEFLLHASMWSSPPWMTRIDDAGVKIAVNEKHYGSYSLYVTKYVQAYKEQGIKLWAINYANEPTVTGIDILSSTDNKMFTAWTMNKLAQFAVDFFAPDLKRFGLDDTKIMFFDDTREMLMISRLWTFLNVTGITDLFQYVGLHSYYNTVISTSLVDLFANTNPNVTVLTTELCAGQYEGVRLGYWERAEFYAQNYIEEMNHFHSAWLDWNLALDPESKPHFVGTDVDAPIIIDWKKGRFYKQPSYYAIGHFSKFIPRGSVYVALESPFPTDLQYAAVLRPDGYVTAVLHNPSNYTVNVDIADVKGVISIQVTANSVNTIVF